MAAVRSYSNAELIRLCAAGDAGAWSAFVETYSPLVSRAIASRVKRYSLSISRDEMDDVRQEVFSALWAEKKFSCIEKPESLPYWIAMVSGNMAIEYIRRSRPASAPSTMPYDETTFDEHFGYLHSDASGDPRASMDRSEAMVRIDKAIASLPVNEQLVIRLNMLYGKKYHEIGEMLHMPHGTVAAHIKRARKKLKKQLAELF